MDIKKKSLVNFWAQLAGGSGTGGCGGGAPYHVPTWVKRVKNKTVLKKIELTFGKSQFWLWIRPNFWDITVWSWAFFLFFDGNFSKYSVAEWVNGAKTRLLTVSFGRPKTNTDYKLPVLILRNWRGYQISKIGACLFMRKIWKVWYVR